MRLTEAYCHDGSICPGRHLAERNGTVLVAAILSAYDIQPPIGEIVPTLVEFTGTQLRCGGRVMGILVVVLNSCVAVLPTCGSSSPHGSNRNVRSECISRYFLESTRQAVRGE
jgi:hypothetical protein